MHCFTVVALCLCCVLPVHAKQVLCDPYISSDDYLEYGNQFLLEQDYSLATYSYNCAVQGDETNIAARKGLVLLYFKRGDDEAAFEQLRIIYR